MNITTSNRRLLKLADFLEELPPEKFDFKLWVGDSWKGSPDLSCGTKACALGWATVIPAFRRAGLRLVKSEDGHSLMERAHSFVENIYTGSTNTVAGAEVFGLSHKESFDLFVNGILPYNVWGNEENLSSKQFAKLLRKFVKER